MVADKVKVRLFTMLTDLLHMYVNSLTLDIAHIQIVH